MRTHSFLFVSWLLLAASLSAAPLGTAITYSGRLTDGGAPANGNVPMVFALYDAATGGNALPPSIPFNVPVSNGLFTVELDFGSAAFNGEARWMQITVNSTPLIPRQRLAPTPYAIHATTSSRVPDGAITATMLAASAVNNSSLAAGAITAPKIADAQVVKSLNGYFDNVALSAGVNIAITPSGNGLQISAPGGVSGWGLAGNTALPGSFLGTTNNQPLEVRVNNARALRLEPNATAANVIGGFGGNYAGVGVEGAFIGGGGAASLGGTSATNRVLDLFGTVAGGASNTVGTVGAVGDVAYGFVGGGYGNAAEGHAATIGGGAYNHAAGNLGPTIGGGWNNEATGSGSLIAGGVDNTASASRATVGGGGNNSASGDFSTVIGGENNAASGWRAVAAGGFANVASGQNSFAAGRAARAAHDGSFVWADWQGGVSPLPFESTSVNQFSVRASGGINLVDGHVAINDRDIRLRQLGDSGSGLGWYGPGKTFQQSDLNGPVLYGWQGGTLGSKQFGERRNFAWYADGSAYLHIAGPGFFIDSPGGADYIRFNPPPGDFIDTGNVGARLSRSGVWQNASDRNRKTDFEPINQREMLRKLAALPVTCWRYTNEAPKVRHVGPTAQDFKAAFGLGADDKSIGTIDADGVALAALQGLYQVAQEQQSALGARRNENAALKQELASLKKKLAAQSETMARWESRFISLEKALGNLHLHISSSTTARLVEEYNK